jgi:hypothetical protein
MFFENKNLWFILIILLIIGIVILQIYYYQKKEEERKKTMFELEQFENQLHSVLKKSKDFVLSDDDVLELLTNYEKNQQKVDFFGYN